MLTCGSKPFEVFFIDDTLLLSVRFRVLRDELIPAEYADPAVLLVLNMYGLAYPKKRYGIAVIPVRNHPVGRDFPRMPVHFCKRHPVDRFELSADKRTYGTSRVVPCTRTLATVSSQ